MHLMETDLGALDENWEFSFSGHHYIERALKHMTLLYAGRDESGIRGPNAGRRSTYVDWDVFAAGALDTFDRRKVGLPYMRPVSSGLNVFGRHLGLW